MLNITFKNYIVHIVFGRLEVFSLISLVHMKIAMKKYGVYGLSYRSIPDFLLTLNAPI